MPDRYDKLLVTHEGALRRKYGADGYAAVRAGLDALVEADLGRGLRSRVLLLDNTTSMRAVGATKVPDGDWVATLKAVDLAWTRYAPAYVAVVGASDVVPQPRIRNPLAGQGDDPDPHVPGDLAFACDLPDSWTGPGGGLLDAGDLLAVTRVVGRIPDLPSATEPDLLLAALATATGYRRGSVATYQKVFALSAAVWEGSTTLSVDLLPGPAPVTGLSPPEATGWTKTELSARAHFVNCHGTDTTPDWFGQAPGGPIDTVALAPEDVDGRIRPGTVLVAECCYGSMHMVPADIGQRIPVPWAYLRSGGYAAVGASTVSYGPADGNGQADLICRFALEAVKTGASSGRAMLDARQRFIRETGSMAPEDLKTLAQFELLGDPSLVAVALPGAPSPGAASPTLTRRRVVLAATGRALAASVPRAGRPRPAATVTAGELAREAGLRVGAVSGGVTSYSEQARSPRAGYTYHVVPVRDGERLGFVVSRETGGRRQTRTIWRR